MQRLPLPGCNTLGQATTKTQPSSDFALRDILERWAGSDDTLRVVMLAKAEEDKLKQEVMRLEVRRTEMEMLKDAMRAGVPGHLIPQIFSNAPSSVYTPVSPRQAPRVSMAAPQVSPYKPASITQQQSMTSPRYLPKLETPIAPSTSFPNAPASIERRGHHQSQSVDVTSSTADIAEGSSSSLFFHHWQPPAQGSPAIAAETNGREQVQPASPTPRKKKIAQPVMNPALSARRSPTRSGHTRHRSEATGMGSRYGEHFMYHTPQQRETLHERETPSPRLPPPSSFDLDAMRKRKREDAESARPVLAPPANIQEESVRNG